MIRDFNDQVVSVRNQQPFSDLPLDWEKDYIRRGTTIVAKETPAGTRHATVDHLGTPRLWHRSDRSVQARHDYLPFGEEVTFNQHGEQVQFTGHERDAHESGGCSGTEVVDNELLNAGEQIVGCDAVTSQDTTVAGTQTVRFTGGREVRLGDGFNVNAGSSFAVAIDGYLKQDRQDLDYMHARYASPFLGRFASVDPVNSFETTDPQSWNRYAYVSNNPLLFVDPNGELRIKAVYLGQRYPTVEHRRANVSVPSFEYHVRFETLEQKGRDYARKGVGTVASALTRSKLAKWVLRGIGARKYGANKLIGGTWARTDLGSLSGTSIGEFEGAVQDKFKSLGGIISGEDLVRRDDLPLLQTAIDATIDSMVENGSVSEAEAALLRSEYNLEELVEEAERDPANYLLYERKREDE